MVQGISNMARMLTVAPHVVEPEKELEIHPHFRQGLVQARSIVPHAEEPELSQILSPIPYLSHPFPYPVPPLEKSVKG